MSADEQLHLEIADFDVRQQACRDELAELDEQQQSASYELATHAPGAAEKVRQIADRRAEVEATIAGLEQAKAEARRRLDAENKRLAAQRAATRQAAFERAADELLAVDEKIEGAIVHFVELLEERNQARAGVIALGVLPDLRRQRLFFDANIVATLGSHIQRFLPNFRFPLGHGRPKPFDLAREDARTCGRPYPGRERTHEEADEARRLDAHRRNPYGFGAAPHPRDAA